jgi:LysM repeat protein
VARGDTPWSVARNAKIRVEDLMRWNRLTRNATLHLGQRLRLQNPDGAAVASMVSGGN